MRKIENKKTKSFNILSRYLFEQESTIAPSETDPVRFPRDISLDQKVDKYLISYEKEAVPTGGDYGLPQDAPISPADGNLGVGGVLPSVLPPTQQVGESRVRKASSGKKALGLLESLFLLNEEDDPAAADAGGGDMPPTDDAGAAPPDLGGGDAGVPQQEAPVINTPKINLNNFATGVARLIQNYETLLNPKVTILNRAIEYIKVNYDEPTSIMFKEMMEESFDIKAEIPLRDGSMAPLAVGAAAEGGGGTAPA